MEGTSVVMDVGSGMWTSQGDLRGVEVEHCGVREVGSLHLCSRTFAGISDKEWQGTCDVQAGSYLGTTRGIMQ